MADMAAPAPPGALVESASRALSEKLARHRRDSASFGDLVHARWYHKRHPKDAAAERRWQETRTTFEDEHGKIVDDYWSKRQAAGLALCCKRRSGGRLEWSMHRAMGDLATAHPGYSPVLLRIARHSVRAQSLLRGMTQRMATANLFALSRDIMASLESKGGDNAALNTYRRDLDYITHFTGEAGKRAARVVYVKGLLCGLVALVVLAPVLASLVTVPEIDYTLLVGCMIAGALGAVMSVLIRLSGDSLDVDHQFGRDYLMSLAAVRPFIGAVFSLLIYFTFQADLLQQVKVPESGSGQFAFYITAAFLIGFSERFAKQIVRTAETGAGGAGSSAPETGST
jgi:hypothetical protein